MKKLFIALWLSSGFVLLRIFGRFRIPCHFVQKLLENRFPVSGDFNKEGRLWNRNIEFQLLDPRIGVGIGEHRIGLELYIRGIWKEGAVSVPFRSGLSCSFSLMIREGRLLLLAPRLENVSALEKVAGFDFNKIVLPLVDKIFHGTLAEMELLNFKDYGVPRRFTRSVKVSLIDDRIIISRD